MIWNQNKISPAYAPGSNATAGHQVQEHWLRSWVMLLTAELSANVWAEALHRTNWMRNKWPCLSVDGRIPLPLSEENAKIDFGSLHAFGNNEYIFIYYPQSAIRKLLRQSELGNGFGMVGDENLTRSLSRLQTPFEKLGFWNSTLLKTHPYHQSSH